MASCNSQIDKPPCGCPKRAELPNVNINTGVQSINTERASLAIHIYMDHNRFGWANIDQSFHLMFQVGIVLREQDMTGNRVLEGPTAQWSTCLRKNSVSCATRGASVLFLMLPVLLDRVMQGSSAAMDRINKTPLEGTGVMPTFAQQDIIVLGETPCLQ